MELTHRFGLSLLIAALVLAACNDGEPDEVSATVALEAMEFAFEPDQVTAAAGEITFGVDNVGEAEHNLTIEDANGDVEVVELVGPGESATGTVTLEAGTYTFYCAVPGHREGGQEGTLTVQE